MNGAFIPPETSVSGMNLKSQLQRDEGGFQRYAYQDSEGYWTIGFGRCIDSRRGKGLSLAEADALLDSDIAEFTVAVIAALPLSRTLDEARMGVLVGMAFNLGTAGLLGFKKFLSACERGDWFTAAAHMLDSKWARQVGIRAQRLAEQMRDGEWR